MKKLIVLMFIVVGFAGCCNCLKGTVRSQASVTGAEWRLVQMDGRAFEAGDGEFVLTFGEDGRVTGAGSCNRLTGTFANDNNRGTLTFGGMVSTRKMCPRQEEETRFVKLLGAVDGYTIDGRLLMLFTNGEKTLMLERAE